MEKRVILRQTQDEGGTRHVWASLAANGDVKIESQDLGRGVEKVFGEELTEYEYVLTIQAVDVPALLDALGAAGDVLSALQHHFSNRTTAIPSSFLEEHDIPHDFWSRVGE